MQSFISTTRSQHATDLSANFLGNISEIRPYCKGMCVANERNLNCFAEGREESLGLWSRSRTLGTIIQ